MPASSATPAEPEPSDPDPGWWRHLAVLGWMALFLVVGEVFLEVRAHRRGWDTLIFGTAEVNDEDETREKVYGPTAAFPFRSRIVPVERTPGALRVWVSSASYSMGGNLAAQYIWPVRMGRMLEAEGVRAEVLNAGRVAYDTEDNLHELERDGARWKPDVVVLYQMSTDIDGLSQRLLTRGGLAAASGAQGLDWGTRFIERTTVQPMLKEEVSSRITLVRPLAESLGTVGEGRFEERVLAWVAACRDRKSVV